jgi:hypothetical protein
MKANIILILPLLVIATSCQSGPQRIDPGGDQAVTSAGVDFNEIIEWTDTLTQRMLTSGFLDTGEFGPQPIRMVVSDIENKTDLSHFPSELLLTNIRTSLLQSGKARWVSTYGEDGRDDMTRDTRDLANDPLFKQDQIPQQGTASVARLSLRTQLLWTHSQGTKSAQNTYIVRQWVTDTVNGEVIWEGQSNPIAKKFEKGSVSW